MCRHPRYGRKVPSTEVTFTGVAGPRYVMTVVRVRGPEAGSPGGPLKIASSRMGTYGMRCAVRMTCSASAGPTGGDEMLRAVGAGTDHRACELAGLPSGAGGSGVDARVASHVQPPSAGVCEAGVAAAVVRGYR